jgi:hypothetical protein
MGSFGVSAGYKARGHQYAAKICGLSAIPVVDDLWGTVFRAFAPWCLTTSQSLRPSLHLGTLGKQRFRAETVSVNKSPNSQDLFNHCSQLAPHASFFLSST